MIPIPQPPEEPPVPAPGDPADLAAARPTARKFLRVSGIMIVVLCALNLALFRLDGLDAWFILALILCVITLMNQRRRRWNLLLSWPLVALLCLHWVIATFLAYHLVLGTIAHFTAKPVPPELRWQEPAPEQAAAYAEFTRRYSDQNGQGPFDPQVDTALNTVIYAWVNRTAQGWKPEEDVELGSPEYLAALEIASPFMDEYHDFLAAHRPRAPRVTPLDPLERPSFLTRRRCAQAEVSRMLYLEETGQRAEAYQLYLRLLKTCENEAAPGQNMVSVMINAAVTMLAVNQQATHMPDLITGHEAEVRAVIQRIRTNRQEGLPSMFASEMELTRDYLERGNSIPEVERVIGHVDDSEVPEQTLEEKIAEALLGKVPERLERWPFLVRTATMSRYSERTQWLLGLHSMPAKLAYEEMRTVEKRVEGHVGPQVLLYPNFRGIGLSNILVYTRPLMRLRFEDSMLAAYEYALTWHTLPAGAELPPPPIDPMSGEPFFAKVTLEKPPTGAMRERLVVAGGTRNAGAESDLGNALLAAEELQDKYLYALTLSRPTE